MITSKATIEPITEDNLLPAAKEYAEDLKRASLKRLAEQFYQQGFKDRNDYHKAYQYSFEACWKKFTKENE